MTNSKTMTRTQLEIHYQVMMKRIAKNLSAEKLSFLIGAEPDYVNRVEMLESDPYAASELECIATALEETSAENFSLLVADDTEVLVQMDRSDLADKCIYRCSIVNPEQELYNYFTLQENAPANVQITESNEYDYGLAREAVALLIKAGYFFDHRLPVTIYQSVNRFLAVTLSPAYLENALNSFCTADHGAPLQKQQNSEQRFVYTEA